ncbi:MAG: S9 family peptidase [Henriciella sp.]|nr:S9 family peptidase [Henriciella sp.]
MMIKKLMQFARQRVLPKRVVQALCWTAASIGVCAAASAQTVPEKFGTMPATWSAQVSPNGAHLALGCSPTGVRGVCIYELDGTAKPRLILPPEEGRIQNVLWGSDDYLIYELETFERLNTSSGLRDYNIRRMVSYSLKTEKTAILLKNVGGFADLTYIESRLVNDPGKIQSSISFGSGTSESTGSRLNKSAGAKSFIVYDVDLKSGQAKVKESFSGDTFGAVYDASGERLALLDWNPKNQNFEVISTLDGRKTVFQEPDAQLLPFYVAGLGDSKESLIVSFDDETRYGLYHLSLLDGAISEVTYNEEHIGRVATFQDPFTNEVIGYRYTDDLRQDVYISAPFDQIAQETKDALQADSVILTSWSKDRTLFTIRAITAGRPDQFFLYDLEEPSISPIGGEAPWLEGEPLGQVQSFEYAARDGMTLYGYMTTPPGASEGPLPMVLLPHGGPEARDTAHYDWLAQAIASQGYLVLQPNFRGSAGYGQAYRDAGFGEFGGKMIEDIVDAAKWAQGAGLAAGDEYCVIGASYGGYAAMMTDLHDPQGVQCLVSINGVSNPSSLVGSYDRDGIGFAYWEQYMGDQYKLSDDARTAMTPLDRSGEFTAAMLLMHGREDTVVPVSQSRAMNRKLESQSNFRYAEIDGDDHFLSSTDSRLQVLTETLSFLEMHHPVD